MLRISATMLKNTFFYYSLRYNEGLESSDCEENTSTLEASWNSQENKIPQEVVGRSTVGQLVYKGPGILPSVAF